MPSSTQERRQPIEAKIRRETGTRTDVAVAPDEDSATWRARLGEILATESPHFIDQSLRQIIEACRLPLAGPSTTSLSAALQLVASLKPENEAQAAMAIHVACLHCASLNVLARLHGVTERHTIAMATAAAKLERAFQLALETYQKLRTGAHQVVRIERVEVQAGAQAVIGVARGQGA